MLVSQFIPSFQFLWSKFFNNNYHASMEMITYNIFITNTNKINCNWRKYFTYTKLPFYCRFISCMFAVPCLISYCLILQRQKKKRIFAGVEGEESENKRVKIRQSKLGSHVNVRANDSKAKFHVSLHTSKARVLSILSINVA